MRLNDLETEPQPPAETDRRELESFIDLVLVPILVRRLVEASVKENHAVPGTPQENEVRQ